MRPWLMAPTIVALLAGIAGPAPASARAAEPPLPALPPLPDPMGGRTLPEAAERIVWNKIPPALVLPVGRERLVLFPGAVRIGFPPELGGETLRTQIVDGTVYWTALKEFKSQRIQVQSQASGNVYLFDLAAAKSASATPIEVVLPERPAAAPAPAAGPATATASAPPAEPPKPPEQDYATLIRTAAQQVYAPARLRRLPEGVRAAPVAGGTTEFLLRGGAVEATPLAAWRSGSLHVTAVKLRNRTYGTTILDPRRLRGRWLAAAFQHGNLAGRGDLRDTTALYLVSDRPYAEALDGR